MDDHRLGSTGTLGQLAASRQPQTTNADDFPPLSRNGADEIDERQGSMPQSAGYGGFQSANAFSLPPDQAQARNPSSSAPSSQANNTRASSVVDRLTSPNGIGYTGMVEILLGFVAPITNITQSFVKRTLSYRTKSSTTAGKQCQW